MDLCRNFEYNYNLNVNLITFLIKYNLREFNIFFKKKNKYLRVYGLSSYANLKLIRVSNHHLDKIFHNCIKIYIEFILKTFQKFLNQLTQIFLLCLLLYQTPY